MAARLSPPRYIALCSIGLGSWPGPGPRELTQKESVSHRILYDAVERGINVIDTADVYGCAVIRHDAGVRELGGRGVGSRGHGHREGRPRVRSPP